MDDPFLLVLEGLIIFGIFGVCIQGLLLPLRFKKKKKIVDTKKRIGKL